MKKLRKEKFIKKKEQAEIKKAVKGMVLNPGCMNSLDTLQVMISKELNLMYWS